MLKGNPVPLPKGRNLYFKRRKNKTSGTAGTVYIEAEISRTWDPEKGYTRPKSVVIGKLCEDREGWMIPNSNFHEVFPTEPLNPVVAPAPAPACDTASDSDSVSDSASDTASEAIVETTDNGVSVVELEMPENTPYAVGYVNGASCFNRVKEASIHVGGFIALNKIAEHLRLPELLEKNFNEFARPILDFAFYMILEESNVASRFEFYASSHPLFSKGQVPYSNAYFSRLFNNISHDSIAGFVEDWNGLVDKNDNLVIYYDSTNKNSQAEDISFVEYGKPKVNVGAKQYNLSIAYDLENGKPVLYELFSGSINDVKQFNCFLKKLVEYGYKNTTLVLDRGYFSEKNLADMEENGHDYIVMCKGQTKLINSLIDKHRQELCASQDHNVFVSGQEAICYVQDTVDSKAGTKRYYHLYYSPSKFAKEFTELNTLLTENHDSLNKKLGCPHEPTTDQEHYFDLKFDKKKNLIKVSRKSEVIKDAIAHLGCFAIVTSYEASSEVVYKRYMTRDCNEKIFLANKTFLGAKSARVHSADSLSGKTFIEFIAGAIRNRAFHLFKDLRVKSRAKQLPNSIPVMLKEFERITLSQVKTGGRYILNESVAKLIMELFAALGLDEETLNTELLNISNMLYSDEKTIKLVN